MQPCHMSNLMQSLSHIFTYQMENWNMSLSTCRLNSHFEISIPKWSVRSLITLTHPSLYKTYLMQLCYIKHEQKECREKKTVRLLLSCSLMFSQASELKTLMWLLCFVVFPLACVSCSFPLLIWVVSRLRAAEKAQTSHWGALFSPLGLCEAPWVLFPLRLCPVLCLLTCVVHSCSPLLS